MAQQLSIDSELMHQQVAAVPVPSSRRFGVVLDENRRPLVFSIGNDGIFYLIISDENGVYHLQDFGARLGFFKAAQAFAVSQTEDGTLLIVFAMTHENDSFGDLRVLGPLKPADLHKPDADLRTYLLNTVNQPQGLVFERILIGPLDSTFSPVIIAVHQNNRDTDIARVVLQTNQGTATWKHDLDLPQNANVGSLTDLCPGNTVYGPGIFYLYEVGSKLSLVFITSEKDPDYGNYYRVSLGVPNDARSLAVYSDPGGYSGLLIAGGQNLYLFTKNMIRVDRQPLTISTDPLYAGVDNLFVAQRDEVVSIWFKNGQQVLGYQEGDRSLENLLDPSYPPVPLTTAGEGAQFAAILDPASKSQRLLVADTHGVLTLMEQSVDSRLWKETPFHVPSLEKNIDFATYTTRVKLTSASGTPLSNTSVLLASSDWVTATVNGKTLSITTSGVPVQTDPNGALTLIVPANSISCYTFSIKDIPGSNYISSENLIDPTSKVVAKLQGMTSEKLRSAKTADGEPVIDPAASDADVKAAADAISQMHDLVQDVQRRSTSTAKVKDTVSAVSSFVQPRGIGDMFWDAWHWIEEQWDKVTKWVVEKIGDAWRFIVTIAGQVWNFVLDTAAHILKAIEFVFARIGAAFEKLIEWLGFIFSWGDILETSDGITSMVNGLLTFGSNYLSTAADFVDGFFDDLESSIRQSTGVADTLKNETAKPPQQDSEIGPAADSAPANWSNYQLEYGGVKENLVPVSGASLDPGLDFFWNDLVKPIWQEIQSRANQIGDRIVDIYRHNPNTSMGTLLKELGVEILLALLGLIKTLASGIVRAGSDIIAQIRNILNQEMKVPVIGALFKLISGGRPLSLLNALSLLVAVPVTVLAKIVTGEKPKRITNFDYQKLVDGTLDQTTLLPYTELASWVTIVYYILNGIVQIYKAATYQIPQVPDSPVSPTMLDIGLKLLVAAFSFPYDRDAPRWPVRISIWSMSAGNILLGGVLQRSGVSVKATVGFDLLVGLTSFVLSQVVHDGELSVSASEWDGKDTVSTLLRTVLSVIGVIEASASAYGQLAPDPIEKAVAVVIVGTTAAGQSITKGAITARARELDIQDQ